MGIFTHLKRLLFLACLVPLLGAGCATGPGKGFSLFGAGHRLLDTAKDLRAANAHALSIPRELEKEPLPSFAVEPGDVLLVQPLDLDSPVRLPGDQPILSDGTINLGKYARLQVAGRTLPEIEEMVNQKVKEQTKDAGFLSVRLVSRVSKVYYVIGEVNSPGAFQLAGRETVLDALLAAGGLTDRASRDNIILARPSKPHCCRTVLPICWRHIVQLGDTTTNYQIAPGDRIYVPGKTLVETVLGSKHSDSPCNCGGAHRPCMLPSYVAGPCPEDAHGAPLRFAPSPVPLVAPAALEMPAVPAAVTPREQPAELP